MASSFFRVLRLLLLAVGTILVVLGGVYAMFAVQDHLTNKLQNSYAFLNSKMPEFVETASGSRNKEDSPLDYAALKQVVESPKIVAISTHVGSGDSGWVKRVQDKIDPIMLSLPKEWQPVNADEVNIVVACSWETEHYGDYSNGAKGYIDSGIFVGYDLKTGVLLFEGSAVGGEPPSSTKSKGSIYGSRADENLVQQIRNGLNLTKEELRKITQAEAAE